MSEKKFAKVSANESNTRWKNFISRTIEIDKKQNDIRSEFFRDYTRILHSTAYRRLKNKTQVFFAPNNDHICTRMEHVNHVASISYIIAKTLGLNTELTNAIAIGHDLGHSPFGHRGEKVLEKIVINNNISDRFWHERNSLKFVDKIETTPNIEGKEKNLNLTYAVRDGIICHCGEVNENNLIPRNDYINLEDINYPGQFAPYSWEGCIVKISDKIAYLGRDIEDAFLYKILSFEDKRKLICIGKECFELGKVKEINNTVLIHHLIIDLIQNSSPETGVGFSDKYLKLMNTVKDFNYDHIYKHPKIENYNHYVNLIITSIFNVLKNFYDGTNTINNLNSGQNKEFYSVLTKTFRDWLLKYSDIEERNEVFDNSVLYKLSREADYLQAIIDFISGMTDKFAIQMFNEIISF